MKPTSISSMVDGLAQAERQRLRVFAEFYRIEAAGNCAFSARQRGRLMFLRWRWRSGAFGAADQLDARRLQSRRSLGGEWGSPFF